MESGRGHGGVMRGGPGGKKMRKRKELDALVGGVGVKRSNGGNKRPGSGGVSPQDQLLSESTGEEEYWSSTKGGNCGKGRRHYNSTSSKRKSHACTALLRLCTILLVMACLVATITVMWLFIDIKEQTTYLRSQLDQGYLLMLYLFCLIFSSLTFNVFFIVVYFHVFNPLSFIFNNCFISKVILHLFNIS